MNQILSRLSIASKKGKLVLFLGAGTSKSIDKSKPDWLTLTDAMLESFKNQFDDLEEFYDLKNSSKKQDDQKYILSRLEEKNPVLFWEKFHENIYEIPHKDSLGFPHILLYLNPILIITTNWDRLLDGLRGYEMLNWKDHFRDKNVIQQDSSQQTHHDQYQYLPLEKRFNAGRPSILYLHGHISRLESILSTNCQYRNLYVCRDETGKYGYNIAPQQFNEFDLQPNFSNLFGTSDVEVLFFGTNPTNSEFKGLVKSIFKDIHKNIYVLSSKSILNVANDIKQDITLLKYPTDRYELALDFLLRLEPRTEDGTGKKLKHENMYKVFSTIERQEYLDAQRELEKNALAIMYCTPKFTNVFSEDDTYIDTAARDFAKSVYGLQEKSIFYDKNGKLLEEKDYFEKVRDGMKRRRDNLLDLIEKKVITSIYVLFKDKPNADDIKRINYARKVCEGKVNLYIRQINWELKSYKLLDNIEPPFEEPSMALIIGNPKAKFKVALCHASQATTTSYVRFQWIHTDTIFAENRLAWFDRAWELGKDYI